MKRFFSEQDYLKEQEQLERMREIEEREEREGDYKDGENMEIVELVNNHLCPRCDHPFLDDSIPIGTKYGINRSMNSPIYRVLCGGCKLVYDIGPTVMATSILNPEDELKPLPLRLFE